MKKSAAPTARKTDILFPMWNYPNRSPSANTIKMHLDYLKQHRRGRYSALLGEGRLNAYLSEIDEQAHEMLSFLTVKLAKAQGVDEHLKETDQIRWMQMMNNVKTQVEEIILKQIIFHFKTMT